MFALTDQPINVEREKSALGDIRSGGYASFEGWVRNHNEGKTVSHLGYEAYQALAESEGKRIIELAKNKFNIHNATCIHRTGTLKLGEAAVWVGVTAKHRDEAFKACRFIIDTIKQQVPIWKHEFYEDGTSTWVNCTACSHPHHHQHEISADDYYARQTALPEVGEAGQKKLNKAKVLVIGAGGLGASALEHLARSGVGHIGIVEYDTLETSNLHRQALYSADDIGKSKAEIAKTTLTSINPLIQVSAYSEALNTENAEHLFNQYNWVLDCTDNFETRFLINDTAYLTKTPVISSSVHRFEGRLSIINPHKNTACLRCLWAEPPTENCIGNCEEDGVIGAVPAMLGTLQALEVIKQILELPSALEDQLLIIDLFNYDQQKIRLEKNPNCTTCGKNTTLSNIKSTALYEVEAGNVNLGDYHVVDIRKIKNRSASVFQAIYDDVQKPLLIVCSRGRSSLIVATNLNKNNISAMSLKGGIKALEKIKPDAGVLA